MDYLKKIFSPFCITISFFLLTYTFYKSEIQWEGLKRSYYSIYYFISFGLIFFSLISFYLNYKIKEYLIIIFSSIFLGLYTFEFYLSFYPLPTKNNKVYEQITEQKFDPRSKIEIYNDLKKDGKDYSISIPPTTFLKENIKILPFSGISNSKTIFCKENGYYAIYDSDRYGFNNPDKEWDNKNIEYLLVGDSFTQGACVNRPNDIGSVLRTLSKKSVLNLGYASNGPLIEYSVLREYLNTNIKNILWIYYEGNDLHNLENELGNNILVKYLQDLNFSQNLKSKQNLIDNALRKKIGIEEKKSKFKLSEFIKFYNLRSKIIPPPSLLPRPELKKILSLTKTLSEKNNSKFFFVYLPTYDRYNSKFNEASYIEIKKILKDLKIPLIDIHKGVFEKEKNPKKLFPFELPGHYTIEGYEKTAKNIYNFINK